MASPAMATKAGAMAASPMLPVAPSRPLRYHHLAGKAAAGAAAASPAGVPGAPGGIAVRCLQLSPDGRQLAAGDQSGNLRVFDLKEMRLVALREAHDSEVLALSFSPLG